MTFAENLKMLRKQAGMSQEQLAEKLGVSRQAVTKWETGAGIPDIENIMAISMLFDISIDDLLSNERDSKKVVETEYLYESITEYDIDESKHYDMKLEGAKIDDIRKRIDIDVKRKNGATEAMAKSEIDIFVQIPVQYIDKIECEAHAETVEIRSIECENMEFGVKTTNLILENVVGSVEVDCNLDMEIMCDSLNGEIAINQVSATSKIHVPEEAIFQAVAKGIGTSISYEKAGQQVERFDAPEADNVIELNGIKSELIVCIG